MELTFTAELWEWQGQGAWCFISLPKGYYDEIRLISTSPKKGFRSVKVEATVGETTWKTSIFPDSKSHSYLLPVKKDIRKTETLEIGSAVSVKLRLIEV